MNKKYLLQIIIIASLVFGGFALFILLFLTKHQILFFTDALFKELVDSPQKRTEKTEEVSMIFL